MEEFERHNGVSGNDPAEYEFYEALDEILGHRPMAQQGFDSSQPEEVTLEELNTMEEDDARISLEMYDDDPGIDGAIAGGSTTPGIQKQAAATPSGINTAPVRPTARNIIEDSSDDVPDEEHVIFEGTVEELESEILPQTPQVS
ncbi:hypothetical protein FQA39_LY01716 [Lamprigera yunnana]|nr:hypothetical protein FQA39_LY01716 [Lamprigera yunnana]